jgi:hypothetical protein
MTTYTKLTNERIGELGEAFIHKRVELGLPFDDVWDEWKSISNKLKFILVDFPEVLKYCSTDAIERKRLRDVAKQTFGKSTLSYDVQQLCIAANYLDLTVPMTPYELDLEDVREFLHSRLTMTEERDGLSDGLLQARQQIEDENWLERLQGDIQNFAVEHSLWAVSSENLMLMYFRHNASVEDVAD